MTATTTLEGNRRASPASESPTPTPESPETPGSVQGLTGACALDGARAFIRRYVSLSDVQLDAVVLWSLHTHCFSAAEATPYLQITAVTPRAGKTRLLEVLELLVDRPWMTGRITGPAVVWKVGLDRPTLLLDETDSIFTGHAKSQEMLRGVLNAGYKRGGTVTYARGQGVQELEVFCPKAFAGIGALPSTIEDRCIRISMKRKNEWEQVERMRHRDAEKESRMPRAALQRFAAQHEQDLSFANPEIPRELNDRAADVWEPLLAIADAIGGEWPERARNAAVLLSAGAQRVEKPDMALRLLSDCRSIFDDMGAPRITTERLLESLLNIVASPWKDYNGKPLDARMLANELRPFNIAPMAIRFAKQVKQGYERYGFDQAWRIMVGEVEHVGPTSKEGT